MLAMYCRSQRNHERDQDWYHAAGTNKVAGSGIDPTLFARHQAIIYLLSGRLALPLPDGHYSVSIITEIELLSFVGIPAEEEQRIRDLLLLLDRVQLTDTVRDVAINLRRKNRLNSLTPLSRPAH